MQISCSSVSGVAGYEVFYQLSNYSSSVMSSGTTTNTIIDIISGLRFGNIYNFFVVSYGSEGSTVLPSDHSNNITVELSEWIKVMISNDSILIQLYLLQL